MISLKISVTSFVMLTEELLGEEGVEYFLSAKLNQDPLEEYFSKQRGMGGNRENPSVEQFGTNHLKLVVTGSSAVRASIYGNITEKKDGEKIIATPMRKRPRKSNSQCTLQVVHDDIAADAVVTPFYHRVVG